MTVLISPYLLIDGEVGGMEAHVAAFTVTLLLGVGVVAGFIAWWSSKKGVAFLPRFFEMMGILAFITVLSYALGLALGDLLG